MLGKRRIATAALGAIGERRAAWHYRLRGYRIVERNLRIGGGEIDLVVRRGSTLVFVEVKTRQSLAAGHGFDAVDETKRAQLVRLADAYLSRLKERPKEVRYDVVSLYWTGRRFTVTCFRDAFRPVSDAARPWKWRV